MNGFNYSDLSQKTISDAEETTNNSFGDKETKELLYLYNNALFKIKEGVESFKKSQGATNEQIKSENKHFKHEIKNLKGQMINLIAVKQVYDGKANNIENEINQEKEIRKDSNCLVHNPGLVDEYVKLILIIIFNILDGMLFKIFINCQVAFYSNRQRFFRNEERLSADVQRKRRDYRKFNKY